MICYIHSNGNDVQFNQTHVWIMSNKYQGTNTGPHGFYITKNNIRRAMAYYNARALIKSSWVYTNNVYLPPT